MNMKSAVKYSGFTLVEVLIALVLLGVAFLGFAKLQLLNTQNYSNAYAQTQAVILIEEMISKLNTRRDDAIQGIYNTPLTHKDAVNYLDGSDKLYEQTLYSWLDSINSTLPGGKGAIYCEQSGICVISVHYLGNVGAIEKSMMAHL